MRIAVLVSGGVDSSVALAELVLQGHDVSAFYAKIWLEDELSHLGSCPWQEDLVYVQRVCEQFQVPFEVISLQHEYHKTVVSYTLCEIKAGRTPNPDVMCNTQIKFGAMLRAISSDYDYVATGHYAQCIKQDGIYFLSLSPDAVKDQTYFLARLLQKQLAKVVFPLGHMTKQQVRIRAKKLQLPTHDRRDSQGICFLGSFKFEDFIKCHLGTKRGALIEYETGDEVGRHEGYWFYTVGQRRGIKLSGGPWYVVGKDVLQNIVFISRTYYAKDKMRNEFFVYDSMWNKKPRDGEKLLVKLRHGPHMHRCIVFPSEKNVYVRLETRDQGIAPGQFAVFYNGIYCVGSGIISLDDGTFLSLNDSSPECN